MSSMVLQRLTVCVSYIGQGSLCRTLSPRRNHITQKVRIGGRTLYVSVRDDKAPAEIFLRVKGADCTSEIIARYDVLARLMSTALQYGASVEDLLSGAKFARCRPVSRHDRLKPCSSLPDLIARHLLVYYYGHTDMAHVPITAQKEGAS